MFTLLKSFKDPQVYLSEPISFITSLVIAELFYKFHSFLLETVAFLATWFVLGAIVRFVARLVVPAPRASDPRSSGGMRSG